MRFSNKLRSWLPKKHSIQIMLIIFGILAVTGAVLGGIFARKFVATMTIIDLPGDPVTQTGNPEPGITETQPLPLVDSGIPMPEPWDGVSRVNLLFMGLDFRDWEAGEIPRTDTMILFTLDPLNKTAGIISIPRDLWVNIPGFEYDKINTAYFLGEAYKMPGGGPELARQTVEELLGVPIQYFAQVDFQAFISLIDHIGGVSIDVPEEIKIDPLGKSNTVILKPGINDLSGELALAYARTRSTEGGDFDRSKRQQQVIFAIREKVMRLNMMPTLVANANKIYGDISSGIRTNMTLEEAVKLALKVLEVPESDIKHVVISGEYVTFAKSPDGLDILRPIPDKIRLLRDELFSSGVAVGPAALGKDILELAKLENESISVQNGSSVSGLAASTAEYLRGQGLNVAEETNADYTVFSQVIIVGPKPYTLKYLVDLMKLNSASILNRFDPNAQIQIIMILGDDWSTNKPFP
jgi:LCP family protein required for cell wall assembly